jgi:hypothetical protein
MKVGELATETQPAAHSSSRIAPDRKHRRLEVLQRGDSRFSTKKLTEDAFLAVEKSNAICSVLELSRL